METDNLGTTSKQPKIRNNPDKRGDDKYEGKGFASIITRHLNETYIQTKYSMIHNICSISGDWYEFGNVDGKILTAILASFGSVVILYLFFTPRKVNKPNRIWFIACIICNINYTR